MRKTILKESLCGQDIPSLMHGYIASPESSLSLKLGLSVFTSAIGTYLVSLVCPLTYPALCLVRVYELSTQNYLSEEFVAHTSWHGEPSSLLSLATEGRNKAFACSCSLCWFLLSPEFGWAVINLQGRREGRILPHFSCTSRKKKSYERGRRGRKRNGFRRIKSRRRRMSRNGREEEDKLPQKWRCSLELAARHNFSRRFRTLPFV